MAIDRIAGQMLQATLARDGANLSVANVANATPALFIDVTNNFVGINNSAPTAALDVTGNIITGNLLTNNYLYANGTPISFGSDYSNANVANYLPTYSGNLTAGNANVTGNIVVGNLLTDSYLYANGTPISFGSDYSNANVANYLPTYSGNIGGGNANIAGNITSANANIGDLTVANLTITGNFNPTNISVIGNVEANNISAANNISTANISASGNAVLPTIISESNANINITPNGTGVVNIGNSVGILMGNPTAGNLVSNAVTLTSSTPVNTGIAQLNAVLGKLVPPAPPAFPASQTLSLSGLSTYRMANITQVDNTANSRSVSAGATVTTILRAATYATNTIATAGPGDSGTVTVYRNGTGVGNVTLTGSSNGTYGGNLVISNNQDYNSSNSSITRGFWYVFSAAISGTSAPAGWNDALITDTAAGNTNVVSWYYDNSAPGTPTFSSTSMTYSGANTFLYSSTIPHYTNTNQFTISTTAANVSGNTYPTANTLATGTAGGAFAAPVTVTYNQSNVGSNILNSFQSASFTTTANITTGFGGSSTGPQLSVNNSYATGTLTLTTALGANVLYKSGTATAIDEGNIVVTNVGTGSGNAVRIVNPGSGNTPAYTGSEANFNSQTSTLETYDATVVGQTTQGVLRHNQINYSTGYLPVGPDLSVGRSGTQYFTFKFVRTDVSKFDITYAGNVAGMWVALPGSVIDSSSSLNGWINMAQAYAGSGYPGVNSPGNGSDGCSLGGAVVLNVNTASTSKTCTFGTVSSSSTGTNEIYVRIALTAGQSVTALSLNTASN